MPIIPKSALAVIPYQSGEYDATDAVKLMVSALYEKRSTADDPQHANATPRDLILHESITNLVAEVSELRLRSESLDDANEQLLARLDELETARQGDAIQPSEVPSIKANLTGYASSASSSDDEFDSAQHEQHRKNFETLGKLLVGYEERLQTLTQHNVHMDSLVSELVRYKRQSEALFGALRTELEGLGANDSTPTSSSTGFPATANKISSNAVASLSNQQQVLERRVSQLERELKQRLDAIEGRALWAPASASGSDSFNEPASISEQRITKLETLMNRVVEHCKKAEGKARQEQLIDDAATKDGLYRIFADISSVLGSSDDKGTRRCGEFHGSYDELWSLRDRAVTRLAIFDACGAAFEEARAAELA